MEPTDSFDVFLPEEMKPVLMELTETVALDYAGRDQLVQRITDLGKKFFPAETVARLIRKAEEDGIQGKKLLRDFVTALWDDILSDEVLTCYRELVRLCPLLSAAARKRLRKAISRYVEDCMEAQGREAAQRMRERLKERFPFLAEAEETQGSDAPSPACSDDASPRKIAEHRIFKLPFSTRVSIYIDETGSEFNLNDRGRMAAVVLPQGTPLRRLEHFHSKDRSQDEVRMALDELLATPCGLLGIGSSGRAQKEGWLFLVLRLIRWCLLLIPVRPHSVVDVDVVVEQRFEYSVRKDTEMLTKAVYALNEEENPRRAQIRISDIRFGTKNEGWLPWADVLAFSWRNPHLSPHLDSIREHCLFAGNSPIPEISLKAMTGETVDGSEWLNLLREDAKKPDGVASLALLALQDTCKGNTEIYGRYLRTAHSHLLGNSYEIAELETMAQWLAGVAEWALSPEMRFLWLMSRLAVFNHRGRAGGEELWQLRKELESSASVMCHSMPQAAYHAMLRLAVSDNNAFEFESALSRLAFWNESAGGRPLENALWQGKIESLLGQCEAFSGRSEQALKHFRKALSYFKVMLLSDEKDGERQLSQTASYAAFAAMDANAEREEVEQYLLLVFRKPLREALRGIGRVDDRYGQHLLHRFLEYCGTEEEKEYCRWNQSGWPYNCSYGHPWPLIIYYRWRLATDDSVRRKLVEIMREKTPGNAPGEAVEMIFYAVLLAMGELSQKDKTFLERLSHLRERLPAASDSLDIMEHGDTAAPDFLKKVLPFNYR